MNNKMYCVYDGRYYTDHDRALIMLATDDRDEAIGFRDSGDWGDGLVAVEMNPNKDGTWSEGDVLP